MEIKYNHILLAIDGGVTSELAQQRALDLAQKFKASLTVLMVGKDSSIFTETVKFLSDFTSGKNIKLRTVVEQGSFYTATLSEASSEDYNIVIIGAAEKKISLLKPSMSYELSTRVDCPVLFIRESNSESYFGSLLLPLSHSAETRQKVPYAAALAERFNSTIHILLLTETKRSVQVAAVESFGRQTERFLADRGIKYTVFQAFGVDIGKQTEEYSKKVKADVVLTMVEPKSSLIGRDKYVKRWMESGKFILMTVPAKKDSANR